MFSSDIAFAVDTEVIFESFKKVWDIPLSHGSKVLTITVPRATMDNNNRGLVERRDAINKKIMEYTKDGLYVLYFNQVLGPRFSRSSIADKNLGSHTFDLNGAMPCDSAHAKYWDDAIHFTPAGYDFIGDKVGVALMGLIVAERSGQR